MTVLEGETVALLDVIHFADVNRWNPSASSIISEVKFVRRQTNTISHILVRVTCSLDSHRIFYSYHFCIEHWLINDNS